MRTLPTIVFIATLITATLCRAAEPATNPASQPAADTVVVDDKTEAVLKGSLKFLAGKQTPGGSWGQPYEVAMTGYVMIAFMSNGNLPGEGEYGKTVARGAQFLLDSVHPDGFIAASTGGDSNMYGHGIATIALAELYGQTKDPLIKPKLERGIKLIVNCQNNAGGWRYPPRVGDADISVTVLQVVALRAAKNAGLDVPQKTIDRAVGFVKSCYDAPSGGFTYQPHNRAPGFARTAAAIYSLQVCGLYDDDLVKKGSDFLFNNRNKERGYATYGNFYAGPAQYMIGGDTWKRWYDLMQKDLLAKVVTQGEISYWQPADGGGISPIFTTAVHTTILAMPYHYLPLYQR